MQRRYFSVDVQQEIETLHDQNYGPKQILDTLVSKFGRDEVPSLRTVQSIVSELKRRDTSGTWTVAEASPGFPILDETWTPKTPHEAPPCEGILGLYNTGTRARWYWTCPHCAGVFEPTFDRMKYPDDGTPAERGLQFAQARVFALRDHLHRCAAVAVAHPAGQVQRLRLLRHEVAEADHLYPPADDGVELFKHAVVCPSAGAR